METTKLKILSVEFVKTKSEKVRVRADVNFDGFILKGFKIIRDPKTGKEYVTPPSYLSPKGWRPLFKTDDPKDWDEIQRRILNDFLDKEIEEFSDETLVK